MYVTHNLPSPQLPSNIFLLLLKWTVQLSKNYLHEEGLLDSVLQRFFCILLYNICLSVVAEVLNFITQEIDKTKNKNHFINAFIQPLNNLNFDNAEQNITVNQDYSKVEIHHLNFKLQFIMLACRGTCTCVLREPFSSGLSIYFCSTIWKHNVCCALKCHLLKKYSSECKFIFTPKWGHNFPLYVWLPDYYIGSCQANFSNILPKFPF